MSKLFKKPCGELTGD